MKIENQVCTVEQAIKLKELGVEQTSYYSYTGDGKDLPYHLFETNFVFAELAEWAYLGRIAAFTVSELGMMLPHGFTLPALQRNGWAVRPGGTEFFPYEAQARAALLIHCLENDVVNSRNVNQRLLNSQL